MLKVVIKGLLVLVFVSCFANAQNYETQDIIDVVDYKIDRMKNSLGSDLHKIKVELEELKTIQNGNGIEKEIINLDKSIEKLENNIVQATIDKESFQKEFTQYENLINTNRNIKIWIVGFVLIVLLIAYFIINNYLKKAQEDITKKTEEMLKRSMVEYKKEFSLKDKVNKKSKALINKMELDILNILKGDNSIKLIKKEFDLLRKKYKGIDTTENILLKELKVWIKTIDEKKTRKKVGNFLEVSGG